MNRKRLLSMSIVLVIIAFCVFLSACGRLDTKIHSTIKPDGNLIQEITFQGSGFAGYIGTSIVQALMNSGWQTNTNSTYSGTTIIAKKSFRKEEMGQMMKVFLPIGGTTTFAGIDVTGLNFKIQDYVFVKYITLSFTIPQTASGSSNDAFTKMGNTLSDSMFSVSWSITLPGEITETNADYHDLDTATWNFTYSAIQNGRYISVKSTYIDWPIILGIVAGIIIIVVVIYLMSRRRDYY